jgi:hypothetical protein
VTKHRVIVDAAIERSLIRGILPATTGERREFHGWLETPRARQS